MAETVEEAAAAPVPTGRESRRSAISQAAEEVTLIVESLKRVLDQMEDVLELVEAAERQQTGDEREIESLRRALRQLQSSRGGGSRRPPEPPAQD